MTEALRNDTPPIFQPIPLPMPVPSRFGPINFAVLLTILTTLISSVGGGSWYLANQAAASNNLLSRQIQFEQATVGRLDSLDKRLETLSADIRQRSEQRTATNAILADRITRIEAQMSYLVVSNQGIKR